MSFRSSWQYALRQHFGKRWGRLSVGLLILLLWPVIAFRKYLSFDPVKFTEEWLKLGSEALVILLALEIMRTHQAASEADNSTLDWLETELYAPVVELRRILAHTQGDTALAESVRMSRANRALSLMAGIRAALLSEHCSAAVLSQKSPSLTDLIGSFAASKCESLLGGLCPAGRLIISDDSSEASELLTLLGQLAQVLGELIKREASPVISS